MVSTTTTASDKPVKLARPGYGRNTPLLPRSRPWIRNTTIALAVAAGTPAAADVVGIHGVIVPTATASMIAAAAFIARGGYRGHLRVRDTDRCAEQLCTVMALPPTRAVLKATQWRDDIVPGRPGRVEVRYAGAGAELDPEFFTRIDEIMSSQPWGAYQRQCHDPRNYRLTYVLDDSPAPEPDPEPVARAKRVILKILGPTATIALTELDSEGVIARIEARHDDGARFALSGYRDRIERTVSAVLPGRWRARWDLVGDKVVFEVRPAFPDIIWHKPAADSDTPYEKVAVAFAHDEDGNVMVWRPCIDPHFILIGATGTGKTAAVHTVLTDIAARGWICWVVDGKGMEFIGFRTWPNVQVVASRMEHQVAVIHRAWEEMERRYEAIEAGASEEDFTPILLVVDEFADFRGNLENWYQMVKAKGDPTRARTLLEIASLVRKGRSARVHLVISTQRPDADFFSGRGQGDTRDSLRMRISLGPLSPQGAMMMWYSQTVGTTIPRGKRGRATGVNDDNEPVEIQCFYTPDPRRCQPSSPGYEELEQLRPDRGIHQRVVILPPRDGDDDEDDVDDDDFDEDDTPRRRSGNNRAATLFWRTVTAPWGWAAHHPEHDPVHRRAQLIAARPDESEPYTLLGLSEFLGSPPPPPALPAGNHPVVDADEPEVDRPERETGSNVTFLESAGRNRRRQTSPQDLPDQSPTGSRDDEPERTPDRWSGYGPPMPVGPIEVSIGDLVLIDDVTDTWGIVSSEPGPALLSDDDSLFEITCRTDEDGEEVIEVPEDGEVRIRRPEDAD